MDVTSANGAESKHSLRRGLEEEEGDSSGSPNTEDRVSGGMVGAAEMPIKAGFMKLSAVSYVVRKTLGVRSFVKHGLLSWAGGGISTPGNGEVW